MALPLRSEPSITERRETLAGEVRALMGKHRMSQTELATRIGMGQPSLSRRLSGDMPFDTDELEAICDVLGERLVDLVARVHNMKEIIGRSLLRAVDGKGKPQAGPVQHPLLHLV